MMIKFFLCILTIIACWIDTKNANKKNQTVNLNNPKQEDTFKSLNKGYYNALFKQLEQESDNEEYKNFQKTLILQKEYPIEYLTQTLKGWHPEFTEQEFRQKITQMIEKIQDRINEPFKLLPLDKQKEIPEDNFERPKISIEELSEQLKMLDFSGITQIIECKKTGFSSKNEYYFNSKNEKCSTENAVLDYLTNNEFDAIYTENSFWNAITLLSYFEEVYSSDWTGFSPFVNEYGTSFLYKDFKEKFDKKTESLKICNLKQFIKEQIEYFGFMNINIFRCQGTDYVENINKNIDFLDYIPNDVFIKIISRIIICPSEYGRGLPDLLAFKDNKLKLIEVKRLKEKTREAQDDWIVYFKNEKININIIRVKGI